MGDVSWVGAEGIQVIQEQGQLASQQLAYCEQWWPYCVNNPFGCTFVGVCNQCVPVLPASVKSCCRDNPPAPCFQSILGGGSGGSGGDGQLNTASATITDPNAIACQTAVAVLTACESATAGFDNLAGTVQASCLCYDTANNYVPSAFDGPWSSCAAYFSTTQTSDYAAVASALGLCASAGDVRNGGAGANAGATTSAGVAPATATASGSGSASGGSGSSSGSGGSSGSSGTGAATLSRSDVRSSGVVVIGMLALAVFL